MITTETLQQSISFNEYLQYAKDMLNEKIPRTGMYKEDNIIRYTRSNLEKINDVLQNVTLNQKLYNTLSGITDEWVWAVISEPWCGDAAWNVPALYLISSAADKIEFRIFLCDANPEIINNYQTNGGNAIPKLVCIRRRDGKELGVWGPRPDVLQQQVLEQKKQPDFEFSKFIKVVNEWYKQDMAAALQSEMIDCIKSWNEIL